MTLTGLADSVADILTPPPQCPRCRAAMRVNGGACLSCLLREGMETEEIDDSQSFEEALVAVQIRDSDWRLGNYHILEEIGRGGMGVIYRARQRHSKRIVALKRVLSYHGDSRETLERFRREAEAAASLDHPNILPIYEVGEADGLPFFTMKYATGGTLQQAAPALRNDPRECVRLMAKVTRAIAYAHREGILHRDLKPGNILLDGRGEPMVSDFGLAKWIDTNSDLTRSLAIFGTPGYIAPEQANGDRRALTAAADVYSLGAILFDLLTGRPPFLGEHALAVIRQASEKNAPKLRSLVRHGDRDLETICAKCLERESQARYRSAADLAEDLERWLEGRPIVARPVSAPLHLWRWGQRNPALATTSLACTVLLVAAVGWQLRSARLTSTVHAEQVARRSIAVLPLLNINTGEADTQFAESLTSALATGLRPFGAARCLPVTENDSGSAMRGSLREVMQAGQKTNARVVLTGTRRTLSDKTTRFVLRIADSRNGEPLLTRSFDSQASDGASLISNALARELSDILEAADWGSLSTDRKDPGLQNPAARELIISGRELTLRQDVGAYDRAIGCFEKAIVLEPTSALARSYLASAAGGRLHLASDRTFLQRAEKEVEEALRLAPDLAEAHRARAGVLYHQRKLQEALEAQYRTIELGGAEERGAGFVGMLLKALGRPDEALSWLEMARRWEARPGTWDPLLGDCWAKLGADAEAEAAYRRADELQPELPRGRVGIARLRLLNGDFAAARAICGEQNGSYAEATYFRQVSAMVELFARNFPEAERLYTELHAAEPLGGGEFYGRIPFASALGFLKRQRGDPEGTTLLKECLRGNTAELETAPQNGPLLYLIAANEAALDLRGPALQHLERANQEGWIDERSLLRDPRFDSLREEPRFTALLERSEEKIRVLRQAALARHNKK